MKASEALSFATRRLLDSVAQAKTLYEESNDKEYEAFRDDAAQWATIIITLRQVTL